MNDCREAEAASRRRDSRGVQKNDGGLDHRREPGTEAAVGCETQSRKSEEEEEMSTDPKGSHVFEKRAFVGRRLGCAWPCKRYEQKLGSILRAAWGAERV